MIRSVEDQILAHDGQANEAEISTRLTFVSSLVHESVSIVEARRPANIDAGKAGAAVSAKLLVNKAILFLDWGFLSAS